MSEVILKNVRKAYSAVEVIPNINLTIPDGSFTVLVGPSGCGKSTLLRMIAGLEEVSDGQILIGGQDVTGAEPSERGIAMVFQSYALYPHMTVADNIGFGLKLAKMPQDEREQRVREAADILQLTQLLDRKPKQLSGGQRQRVAIGRAIVRKPKVFLFDEPLSNLDAALRGQMRVELSELHDRLGATMVYVTHDQVEAMTMADQIVTLSKGIIEQVGSPMSLYETPRTPFVAGFIGSPKMNLFSGEAVGEPGIDTFGVRPEHIDITTGDDGRWRGKIRHSELLGAETISHVEVAGLGTVVVRSEGAVRHTPGTEVSLAIRDGAEHRFSAGERLAT
ncbi:MAG: ATP-binding cassette domain-containing protein [Bauldia sp.]|uniref:ABC transporter ATP-binding protein n=1 Tax=Bauldia sp. TaxID=2575872 RepID=UPI001D836244|nr:ATP-binding cassette domain-containing protein [Bauldia sp.]MCB1494202.1 ATP-binding cassette domain-containing protein [Bauldia sp.]